MAGAAAIADAGQVPPTAAAKQGSMLSLMLALLVVTGLGTGVGGLFGLLLLPKAEKTAAGHADAPSGPPVKSRFPANVGLRVMPPIVTNLASPANTWVRIEASLVMEGENSAEANVLAAQIGEDLVAFLRTVALVQIEGASGFQHLREDINDRVRVRSGGRVKDLVFQSFIVE